MATRADMSAVASPFQDTWDKMRRLGLVMAPLVLAAEGVGIYRSLQNHQPVGAVAGGIPIVIWVGFVIPLLMHRRPTFDFARIVFLTVSYLVAVCLGLFAWVVTGIFAPSILGRCIGTAVVAGLWLIPVVRISRLLSRIKQREAERLAVQRQAITTQTTTVVPRRRQIPVFLDAGHTAERTGQDELDDLELGERVRFHLDSWQVIAHSYPEPNERLRAIITVLTRALEGR